MNHPTSLLAAREDTAPEYPRMSVRLAYIMSRFPKLTETFVLNEMRAVRRAGAQIDVYPLLRQRATVVHPDVDRLWPHVRFHPFVSPPILRANWRFLVSKPQVYLRLWSEVLRATWGSVNFFVGAVGIFPKAVRFAYEMERRGVTHVHAHFANHPAVAAFIVHRLTGIPYSFTAHGSDLHVDRRMLDRKVAAARLVIAVSRYNREVIVNECGEHVRPKVHVIHCGVDTERFHPPAERSGHEALRIVCVAAFEEVKGHRYLVEACGRLRAHGVRFLCHLVGDGPLRRRIETQVRRAGLERLVIFEGARPRPDVARLLTEADVAVLASAPTRRGKREGIPVALIEAMACGLPVVASAISGIPELVEPGVTGLLVPPRDPAALADALHRLAGDSALRHRMGRAGRKRIERDFDLHSNARRLLELVGRGSARSRIDRNERERDAS